MKTIAPAQLRAHLSSHPELRFAIVDVRAPDEFRREYIDGSINIPLDTVLTHSETLRPYDEVYLYCRTGNRSGQACDRLLGANIPHVTSIEGGIDEMKRAGFVSIHGKGPLPLQQQVLLGAGSIVSIGIVLSYIASPWFILLSLFAGLGLMYAGASGNCMLAMLLKKMPWNNAH